MLGPPLNAVASVAARGEWGVGGVWGGRGFWRRLVLVHSLDASKRNHKRQREKTHIRQRVWCGCDPRGAAPFGRAAWALAGTAGTHTHACTHTHAHTRGTQGTCEAAHAHGACTHTCTRTLKNARTLKNIHAQCARPLCLRMRMHALMHAPVLQAAAMPCPGG